MAAFSTTTTSLAAIASVAASSVAMSSELDISTCLGGNLSIRFGRRSATAADAANEIADAVRGRTLTEGYAADGAAPTLEQLLFLVQQMLTEMSIAGTTMTIKKLDGTTTAATLTLNDATTPTSITRTT